MPGDRDGRRAASDRAVEYERSRPLSRTGLDRDSRDDARGGRAVTDISRGSRGAAVGPGSEHRLRDEGSRHNQQGDRSAYLRGRDDRGRGGSESAVAPKGRDGTGTPPAAVRDREGPGTPTNGTPGGHRAAARVTISNPMLAELLKHSKALAFSKEQGAADGNSEEADDREAGELPPEGPTAGLRKRKHAPIVWDEGGSKAARMLPAAQAAPNGGGGMLSILERAEIEAAQLKRMRALQDEVDDDAPAAMNASPTFSGQEDNNAPGNDLVLSEEGAQSAGQQQGVVASRWLTMDDAGTDAQQDNHLAARGKAASRGPAAVPQPASPSAAASQGATRSMAAGSPVSASRQPAGLPDDGPLDDFGDKSRRQLSPAPGPRFSMMRECRDLSLYEKIDRISEGSYGVVYKGREKATGRVVALKRIKMDKGQPGFPQTSVREINILLNFHHPNIVNVEEVVIDKKALADPVYMVMEYMDHDLKSLMEDKNKFSQPFSMGQVKCLMQQLLSGMDFLHRNWVLHRDLKTSNILYNAHGELKLCDFGMARQYGSPLRPYTQLVCTLWYRAPELLLGAKTYSTALDMWSVGCIMGELLTGKPLLPGQGELEQIMRQVELLGTPTDADWPGRTSLPDWGKIQLKQVPPGNLHQKFTASTGYSGGGMLTQAGFDLLTQLLAWDPSQRMSAKDALQHRWFKEAPLPVARVLMPTFAARKAG